MTKEKATHTRLLWKSQGTNPPMICGADDEVVCQCDGSVDSLPRAREAANAAFIVRAVNAHYGLLAALRDLAEYVAQEIGMPLENCTHGPIGQARVAILEAERNAE